MIDELLTYYNGELAFLRELGAEFAEKYPKVAARLLLEADKCEDPHVERILEGVAFLTARIRHKIDDEFPEITDALLSILYPHYQRPIPSMSVVQFVLEPRAGQADERASPIERGSRLNSRPVGGRPLPVPHGLPGDALADRGRGGPARPRPGRRSRASRPRPSRSCSSRSAARRGPTFAELALDRLRFYLDGDGPLPYALYELLLNNVCSVLVRGRSADRPLRAVALAPDAIEPVGFDRDEGMLPYPSRSFLGYRLLQEYFAFPEKFLFFDLAGLRAPGGPRLRRDDRPAVLPRTGRRRRDLAVQPENFRLGCTPVVNLFSMVAEPIPLTPDPVRVPGRPRRPPAARHRGLLDRRGDEHGGVPRRAGRTTSPSTRSRHARPGQAPGRPGTRPAGRRAKKDDPGTEVYLSFVDRGLQPQAPRPPRR